MLEYNYSTDGLEYNFQEKKNYIQLDSNIYLIISRLNVYLKLYQIYFFSYIISFMSKILPKVVSEAC